MHGVDTLCGVVESSCLLTHNIAPHTSLHDPPYHKTMKRYEDSQSMEAFLVHPRKFWIQTWFCIFFTISLLLSHCL